MNGHAMLEFLRAQPVITLFLTIGAGYLVGRIKLGGFSLGAVASTLLISLVLGRYGFRITAGAQAVGFAMFVFSVGHQAGPHFIEVLKTQGLRYFTLAVFVIGAGFITALIAGRLLALPAGGTAGLLAGALTASATLAAARDAVHSGVAAIPPGSAPEQVVTMIGSSYAITYVVGLLGVLTALRLLPRVLGVNLEAEARKLEEPAGAQQSRQLQARGYRITNAESCRATVEELRKRYWDGLAILRLRRGGGWIKPSPDQHLQPGDELFAYGDVSFFRGGIETLGPEIPVDPDAELSLSATRVAVTRRDAVDHSLEELDLARRHGVEVVEVRRNGVKLPVGRSLQLQRGDILTVVGPADALAALGALVGPVELNLAETDMMTFAFGIALGTAVGLLSVTIAGVPFGLGTATGLLCAGLAVGWYNANRPTVGRLPEAARWVLMEFGLLIFMCGVGLDAGGDIVETFKQAGPALIVAGMFVVTVPIVSGYAFGRKVLGLNPVLLLGALTGAMTSAPSLRAVSSEAKSEIPALGYSGTYAFANVLLTVAGTLIMLL